VGSPLIDQTYLLRAGKNMLAHGVVGSVDFQDKDLLKCLVEETLPTFSVYVPHYMDYTIDTAADRVDATRMGIYRILTPFDIIGIHQLRDWLGSSGQDLTPFEAFSNNTGDDVIDRQQVADIASAVVLAPTFKFMPPNTVEIFPKGWDAQSITIELQVVHPSHLRTVPGGAREKIRGLFLADLATDVLGHRQYFESTQTLFGDLRLNVDRLQTIADTRSTLIEEFERKKGKTGRALRVVVA